MLRHRAHAVHVHIARGGRSTAPRPRPPTRCVRAVRAGAREHACCARSVLGAQHLELHAGSYTPADATEGRRGRRQCLQPPRLHVLQLR